MSLASGGVDRGVLIEGDNHERTATNPRSPSTRIRAPSGIQDVAWSVPTTAGIPNSRAMIAEWENDRERRSRYEREVLPLATERTQATLAAYRGAKASITDVLLARRSEIDVRMQALQLEMDTARQWAQLNFLFPDGDTATHAGMTHAKDLQ